jgi:cap1 methyltransferase
MKIYLLLGINYLLENNKDGLKMHSNEEHEVNVNTQSHHFTFTEDEEKDVSSALVDKKVLHMMQMMGYRSGFGLGKNEQGMTLPVEIEPQLGRRGFGLKIESLQCSNEEWDFSLDNPTTVENVEWLQNNTNLRVTSDVMLTWSKEDVPKSNMKEEYNFCDKDILHNVIEGKNIFDRLDLKELCQARARANPFETIRSVFFMNRAALKMANIDAATDFMFTNVDHSVHHENHLGPYYFADVCAGPGGFTEYVLWRKKWLFKGFGFTLRDENDFKLTESICASPVTFLPMYGVNGDGNVCCPENIEDFKEKVLHETENRGVHFMMSDGGFSVEGSENIQEILSKNIYICQCLIALEILKKHGHFVTKVFDVFTCFSVGLLYLIYKCFEKVCILKPNSSRPANSERYVICYNYKGREDVQNIRSYLTQLVGRLWEIRHNVNVDITEIVPLSIIKNDDNFYSYVVNSNNRIAKYQTINLQKLATFCRNPLLMDYRQDELRQSCLKYWQIPDMPKVPISRYSIENLLTETVSNRGYIFIFLCMSNVYFLLLTFLELLVLHPREIENVDQLSKVVPDLSEWHYTLMQCRRNTNICNFYAGVGLSKAYRLQCNKWVKVKNLQLCRGTLLYGELVKEKSFSNNNSDEEAEKEEYKFSLHVVDAIQLGDHNLSNLNFEERNSWIQIYCKAINHEFKTNTIRIRPKIINKLHSLPANFCLRRDNTGNCSSLLPILGHKIKEESYVVNSLLLLKTNKRIE